jgi:hypothetical protein
MFFAQNKLLLLEGEMSGSKGLIVFFRDGWMMPFE